MKKIILQGKIMSILDKQITHDVKILKHNTLIEAEYDLSPVPNNLMTLAITKARDSDLPTKFWNGEVIISADEYAKIHNIDIRTAYKDLKRAVLELEKVTLRCDAFYDLNRTASMLPEQLADVAMNSDRYYSNVIIGSKPKHGNFMKMKLHIQLVNRVGYSEEGSFIYFQFSDDVLHLIETGNLDYTMYDYKNTVDLTTTPTKRLYELACKWVKIGNCKKSVDDWRHFFGLDDKYEKIAEFKRWVLIPAIKQINAQGEFELSIEQQKLGKVITHLILKIKDKRQKPAINASVVQRDPNVIDIFEGLSDKENQIVKATADKYIAEKGITDLGYRQNIYKKAKEGRWGLADLDKQTAELQAQNIKITEQIQAEKQAQQRQEHEKAEQEKTNKEFIEYFESLPLTQQAEILTEVKAKVEKLPIIGQNFIENMATSYKDVMYRSYFKKVMGLI